MLKLVPATALGLALTIGGAAFAGMPDKSSQEPITSSHLYKESQSKANATLKAKSVKPKAELRSRGLYGEAAQQALAVPKPQSVTPEGTMQWQLYGTE